MKRYQKGNYFKSYLESWPALFILAMLVLVVAWGVLGLAGGLRDTIKNKNIAAAKVAELQERKTHLAYDIENLETEEGKEKIFRENYGLAKEGEELIVIVEDKNLEKNKTKEKKGVFGVFKGWFSRP